MAWCGVEPRVNRVVAKLVRFTGKSGIQQLDTEGDTVAINPDGSKVVPVYTSLVIGPSRTIDGKLKADVLLELPLVDAKGKKIVVKGWYSPSIDGERVRLLDDGARGEGNEPDYDGEFEPSFEEFGGF